jgi:hypothetical protein
MLIPWPKAVALVATTYTTLSSRFPRFVPFYSRTGDAKTSAPVPNLKVFEDTIQALTVLQDEYFQPWLGTWPDSIDWTAAVVASYVSGTLASLSEGLEIVRLDPREEYRVKENLVALHFSRLVGFYFGQDAFAVRGEAFDDMLWVVLSWLDTIQFIDLHNTMHYQTGTLGADPAGRISSMLRNASWHGNVWVPAFAHRARIFWQLAHKGWDTSLCGGGMNWNPRLEPYKNAITNELYIAASINMYLYFPGDDNVSPYQSAKAAHAAGAGHEDGMGTSGWPARDPRYLAGAIEGYKWLKSSGMTNSQGLYTDGFHISGYKNPHSNKTDCDQRNDMVYTYNQGVILTGQLGLFQVTGALSYLEDGHQLIRDVIKATGWDLHHQRPVDKLGDLHPGQLPPWQGLGRGGVLEEACDVNGDCSQDSQTFKGIYMHHLTAFCAPLELVPETDDESANKATRARRMIDDEFDEAKAAHLVACRDYVDWLRHNANAALKTRDNAGRFGMWWTAGLLNLSMSELETRPDETGPHNENYVDYRTYGIPADRMWTGGNQDAYAVSDQSIMQRSGRFVQKNAPRHAPKSGRPGDPNDRGRGRTVETQGGGVAVLRALWEISRRNSE